MLMDDIKKVLVPAEEIIGLCQKMGKQITEDYIKKDLVVIGLLKGCLPFMSDLTKYIECPLCLDYMDVSSYAGTDSTGCITIKKDISVDVKGKDVLIVDDIIDTGNTLKAILEMFDQRGARSVEACVLLDKPEGRKVEVAVKYIGRDIPKEFVVGYGLDYNGYYRNLPSIGVLKEEIYRKR